MPGMGVYTVVGAGGGMLSGHRSQPHFSCATCIRFNIIHARYGCSVCRYGKRNRHTITSYIQVNLLPFGYTKLIPWSSDFVLENKEQASEISIFVQKNYSIILWSERMLFLGVDFSRSTNSLIFF